MERRTHLSGPEDSGKRLDVFLTEKNPDHSRAFIQGLIKGHANNVLVDGTEQRANFRLKAGAEVTLHIPPPKEIQVTPQDIPLDIVYEDADIAVINKPQGMVVHPAVGNYDGTLVNALLARLKDLSGINGEIRPGIVHRIDKDTSGLLVVAKHDGAHRSLAAQIKSKTAGRTYLAVAEHNLKQDSGTISAPIGRHPSERKKMAVIAGGREAVTHYRVLERFRTHTYLECRLETGRTHQIRVHMAHIGHPLAGDPRYGSKHQKYNLPGQALHAARLTLTHPRTGAAMAFEAPLPEAFEHLLDVLRIQSKKS